MMQRTAVDTQLMTALPGHRRRWPHGSPSRRASGCSRSYLSVAIDTEAGHEAVSALNLAIARRPALVGESGSGKSMTALAMLRLLPAAHMRTGRVPGRDRSRALAGT